ncbi:MAG: HAD family acid phosphatase [Candidatus Nanopelagicales bacterium]|nr:HAD family acid phosphatase [Candidatus Nanopelagicales bacterium]
MRPSAIDRRAFITRTQSQNGGDDAMTAAELPSHVLLAGRRWDERLGAARRDASLGAAPTVAPGDSLAAGDSERGRCTGVDQRLPEVDELVKWREVIDPDDAGLFAKRLEWEGLTPDDARRMLAGADGNADASADAPRDSTAACPARPQWWGVLHWISRTCRDSAATPISDDDWLASVEDSMPAAVAPVPFSCLLWPVAHEAWRRLQADDPSLGVLSREAVVEVQRDLVGRMSAIAARALMVEFSADRTCGNAFLLSLGASRTDRGRSRYAEYCRQHASEGMTGLLTEFPVLGRLLANVVLTWQRTNRELCRRLVSDEADLARRGITGWRTLRLKSPAEQSQSAAVYKARARRALHARGFRIIASVGDQVSDMAKGHLKYGFLLPNPMYYLP